MSVVARPMRVLLIFLVWLLALSCVSPKNEPAPVTPAPTVPPVPAGPPVSFLSLGDSYTIGQSVAAEDRWSVQLARLAQADGLQAPDIIARTGWTTGELQQAIAQANPPATYGLVSLLIGVNNQFRGLPLGEYRAEFRQLLRTAIALAGERPGRVLVLSVPDWGQTPVGSRYPQVRISQEIDQLNEAARQECEAVGVVFLHITDLTRAARPDPAQFAPDGLHYSGLHMRQWADRALPVVRQLLK